MTSPVVPSAFLKHSRTALGIWTAMAIINLCAGLVIASWPERQVDLRTMQGWTSAWLVDGADLYSDEGTPDYPPHAIVTLSPLGVAPASLAAPAWAALNLGMAILAPYLALRTVRATISLREAALPMAMFLCWGGFRTLLQFSLLALIFGLLSIVLARKRPVWSGVCLALALTKPQVGIPFALWALFSRRPRQVVVAAAIVAAEFAAYCLRSQASPVQVIIAYAATLRTVNADETLVGLTRLRPLIAPIFSSSSAAEAVATAIILLLFAVVCIIGFAEGRRRSNLMYAAPSLAGVWALLSFYHLTYGFLILLPTAALLLFVNEPQTAVFRRRLFWALQLALMVDVPGVWRRFGPVVSTASWLNAFPGNVDRLLMLILFVCLLRLATTNGRSPQHAT